MNRNALVLPAAAILVLVFVMAAHAQTPAPSPTPAAAPAPADAAICTDRPTKVYATCTAPAGHFQLETDAFNGAFQRLGGVTTDTWLATNPTLKYGLTPTLDVEANIAPYVNIRTHDRSGAASTLDGVGDLYLRAKYAAYTSADGKLAVSLVPYVKAPTAKTGVGNSEWEGGSAFAVSYKLSDVWTLALAPEVDALKDSTGSGRHVNHIEVINLGRSLPNNVTVYGELWGDWNYDPAGTLKQYSADVAVAWALRPDLRLDGGLNFGLNKYTPGVQVYAGLSKRF